VKILHVIPSVSARDGGPSLAVLQMSRALRAAGHDVLVATTDADGPSRLAVPLGTPTLFEGVPVVFFSRRGSDSFKYSAGLARWLRGNVNTFDVVHIHAVFSHASLVAGAACLSKGVPYVVRPLGSLDPWSLRQRWFRKRVFWYLFVRRMLRKASAIHYTARPEMEMAEAGLGLSGGVVIPLGVENALLEARELALAVPGAPYVLSLSRIHPKKNIEAFLEAFAGLMKEGPAMRWHYVIAGDGDDSYLRMLRDLVRRHSLEEFVEFVGWQDGEKKERLLRGASLFVLPSFQENFGLGVAEALACGVPVLVTPAVNLAAGIRENRAGWVAGPSASELEAGLREALSDESELKRRGAAGHEWVVREMTWPSVAARLVQLYEAVVRRGVGGHEA
jgi:glycosyltransferase involved in cell wall biosynthesis